MFGDRANFHSEVLTFEVVDFLGSYHAILERPCYAKFMAIPNYTYFKLKMLGLNGIITMSSAFSHAFTCDRGRGHQLVRAPTARGVIDPSSPRLQQTNLLNGLLPTRGN